jgi:homoserine O-acetyltransferase
VPAWPRTPVWIGHGTGGNGGVAESYFRERSVRTGQLLDATKYFIILPDGLGHGKSSKPSDGLHAKFPRYTYDDMIKAQYEVLTKKLGVNHLRLVMGTSMGGMQTWVWAEMYPDFMDALMPLASNRLRLPDAIASGGSWRLTRSRATPNGWVANTKPSPCAV